MARCLAYTVQQNHGFPWIWLPGWAAGPPWALGYAQPMRNLCTDCGLPSRIWTLGLAGREVPVRTCACKWRHGMLLMSRGPRHVTTTSPQYVILIGKRIQNQRFSNIPNPILETILAPLETSWDHLGAILGPFGAILGSCCGSLELSWYSLGRL